MSRILLMCAGGMSTSILARRMQAADAARRREDTIWAVASGGDYHKRLEALHPDVLLLGPQIAFMQAPIAAVAAALKLPWRVMPSLAYGRMEGDTMLTLALDLMNS